MTIIERNIIANKNIPDVYKILYEENIEIFDKEIVIINWNKDEWIFKNKILERNETVYTYVPSMPHELVSYLKEKDKFIRLQVKHKMVINNSDYWKIKTKIKILNITPFLDIILNKLNIIEIKNKIELIKIDDNNTNIKITNKIKLNIPKTKAINTFIDKIINNILNNSVIALSKQL